MVNEIAAFITIATGLHQVISSISNEVEKHKARQALYAKLFTDLRKEVKDNLVIVQYLMKQDNSTQAVYDPVIRKNINALRFEKLAMTSELFDLVIGKQLKKHTNKPPSPKDKMRIYWNIRDTARKLEDFNQRMKRIPTKPSSQAPKIILKRRLPALERRLKEINEALSKGKAK
jgi:hypothetical protein